MAALIALAAVGAFAAGIFAGIIAVVSMAIRREERNLTLTSRQDDRTCLARTRPVAGPCDERRPR